MLVENDKNYYINNPVFVKYKTAFDWLKWRRVRSLKKAFINERIVEIPFALEALHNVPRTNKVLDLGCTESPLPLNMASLGYKVCGLDYREYPYVHPNLSVARGDMTKLPFADETFGAVFCISTLEHLGIGFYDDPKSVEEADHRAMAEIKRVMIRHGVLVLTVPFGEPKVTDHQRVYALPRLRALLEGFEIKEMRFFANHYGKGTDVNYWYEIDEAEAAKTRSGKTTECVCLIKAEIMQDKK